MGRHLSASSSFFWLVSLGAFWFWFDPLVPDLGRGQDQEPPHGQRRRRRKPRVGRRSLCSMRRSSRRAQVIPRLMKKFN